MFEKVEKGEKKSMTGPEPAAILLMLKRLQESARQPSTSVEYLNIVECIKFLDSRGSWVLGPRINCFYSPIYKWF